jgi:hypothetical protein
MGEPRRTAQVKEQIARFLHVRTRPFHWNGEMLRTLARLRVRPTSRVECPVHSPRLGLAHRRTIHDGRLWRYESNVGGQAELRSSGMPGLVPRPNVCTCAGFQTPAMRRSHIAGPASGSRQGRNPRILSTRRCGRFYGELAVTWPRTAAVASHISNPHRKGRCAHARKDSGPRPSLMALWGAMQLTSGACVDGVFQLRT